MLFTRSAYFPPWASEKMASKQQKAAGSSDSLAAITFLFNNLPRTLLHALAAAGTFLIIYMSHISFHGNSACLAVFHTFHTADASGFTCFRYILAFVSGIALYIVYTLCRHQFNKLLRAGSDTFAAGFAGIRIHNSHTVYNVNRIELTFFHASPITQTAESTAQALRL